MEETPKKPWLTRAKVKNIWTDHKRPRKKRKEEEDPPYLSPSMSAKDRLLAIIASEKAADVERTLKATTMVVNSTAIAFEDGISCASTETTNSELQNGRHGLIRKGLAGIRRSFKKAAKNVMKKNQADLSHDSGLGEDSDASHTPLIYSASPTTPTPILRTTRSFSNGSKEGILKHVMIREPSLRHLPSALRNSFPGAAQPSKPLLVRLETAKSRQYRYSYQADNLVGDVSPQWGSLYFHAAQEVKGVLPEINCDSRKTIVCDLLFSTNGRAIEDKLMVMEAQEVDETIHLLYKILYFDWMASNHHQQLSIVLHCVQKFLVILIDVCPDLETNDRRRLSICSRGLLRQCEEAKYCPLGECLSRTRTLYIQVWCALLCVPFAVE